MAAVGKYFVSAENIFVLKILEINMSANKTSPRIMVFRPTWRQFQNFANYIEFMESKGAHKAGIVKVYMVFIIIIICRFLYLFKLSYMCTAGHTATRMGSA